VLRWICMHAGALSDTAAACASTTYCHHNSTCSIELQQLQWQLQCLSYCCHCSGCSCRSDSCGTLQLQQYVADAAGKKPRSCFTQAFQTICSKSSCRCRDCNEPLSSCLPAAWLHQLQLACHARITARALLRHAVQVHLPLQKPM
jgi:hypothetical protein